MGFIIEQFATDITSFNNAHIEFVCYNYHLEEKNSNINHQEFSRVNLVESNSAVQKIQLVIQVARNSESVSCYNDAIYLLMLKKTSVEAFQYGANGQIWNLIHRNTFSAKTCCLRPNNRNRVETRALELKLMIPRSVKYLLDSESWNFNLFQINAIELKNVHHLTLLHYEMLMRHIDR